MGSGASVCALVGETDVLAAADIVAAAASADGIVAVGSVAAAVVAEAPTEGEAGFAEGRAYRKGFAFAN